MSHKVHPKAFRIKEMKDWYSRGFYGKNFAALLEEDFKIREFLEKNIAEAGIEKIEIERLPSELVITVYTARPGLIIGRRGEKAKSLRDELMVKIFAKKDALAEKSRVKLEFKAVKDVWLSAVLSSQQVARELEKRSHFRRSMKMALSKIMSQKGAKGARIQVSGRLNGAEMARTEWLQEGQLPRQDLRADIDYGFTPAHCSYGILGVKVWIYKGEVV